MAKGSPARREPTLAEEIAQSGETEKNPYQEALGDAGEDRRFLGREFLTWLVYRVDADNGGGVFRSQHGDSFQMILGERLKLKAPGDSAEEISAKGAAPAQTADVRYAIAGGLTVREVEILIQRGDRTWQLMVSADLFDIKRAKLPELTTEDAISRAAERLDLIDEMESMLKDAYRTFLKARLAPSWQRDEVPRLRRWLAQSILDEVQLEATKRAGKAGTPDSKAAADHDKDEAVHTLPRRARTHVN